MKDGRNSAHLADGVSREDAGGPNQLMATRFAGRKYIADLAKGHLQCRQGLRGRFVQLAREAALLFAAQSEQLLGQMTQVVGAFIE